MRHSVQTIKDQMANRPLLNEIMSDDSRLFLQLPQTCPPSSLLRQIVRCLGGTITAFVSDEITGGTWIDFGYKGWKFSIHNPYGEYCFFCRKQRMPRSYIAIYDSGRLKSKIRFSDDLK